MGAFDDQEDVFGGGGEAISWKDTPAGTTIRMHVTEKPEVVDGTDYNGDPQQQIVVNGLVDGEERSLWMPKRGALAYAIRQAQKESGAIVAPGGVLTVETTGLSASPRDPKKEFRGFKAHWSPPGQPQVPHSAQIAQQLMPAAAQEAAAVQAIQQALPGTTVAATPDPALISALAKLTPEQRTALGL